MHFTVPHIIFKKFPKIVAKFYLFTVLPAQGVAMGKKRARKTKISKGQRKSMAKPHGRPPSTIGLRF